MTNLHPPTESPQPAPNRRAKSWFWSAAVLVCVVSAVLLVARLRRPKVAELMQQAKTAFLIEDYGTALDFANQALDLDPGSVDALLVAGASAASREDFTQAVEFYDRLPDEPNPQVANGRAIAANLVLFNLGRASEAERRFRDILNRDPRQNAAVAGLVNLLGLAGRRREATPLLIELIRQDSISVNQLTLLGSEFGALSDRALHQRCLETAPNDAVPLMGLAWQAGHDGDLQKKEQFLRQALRFDAAIVGAHAQLGTILAKHQRFDELPAWNAGLPAGADEHPEVWLIRGDYAREAGQPQAAVRCYWETLKRNPNYRAAIQHLLQILYASNDKDRAAPFAARARELQKLEEYESVLFESQHRTLTPIRNVAEQMEVLGRIWESYAWSQFALKLEAGASWPRERRDRLQPLLSENPPLTLISANPAYTVDFSSFPLPRWDQTPVSSDAKDQLVRDDCKVRFEDRASATGLMFQYFNSGDPASLGQYMYEFSGGGVAVLDYDLDGWPDLYFTQGCEWPSDSMVYRHVDRLFRNVDGSAHADVTGTAQLAENGYSQGVAVGDFDNDGFPDIYVANIGINRLYHNNGDGTFSDATSAILDNHGHWTTSCLVADLNGDGFPDLYDANYLSGSDIFEKMCRHKDGVPRMCAPFDFPAAQDQFYLNSGDGRFVESTSRAGFKVSNGKGLGLVAADFDNSGRLSLFVANDLVPNFYFQNQTEQSSGSPLFAETAQLNGLSFDHAGNAQGSMGIAVADLNDDRRLDLFVTNFAQERNAFYTQVSPGLFQDDILKSGIGDATLPVLGFGTQAVDGELDGYPDLIVTNGHVDDHRAYNREYRMPPQYFRNRGEGLFDEVAPETIGPFFQGKYLGRGMARLDWNRDGREDVVISHLDAPAALLMNTTERVGHFLAVKLVGTVSSRDAIGTSVLLESPGRVLMRQMTAGAGYQASNQRLLVFGLGDETNIDRLEVRWPSGNKQVLKRIPIDQELVIIEQGDLPFTLTGRGAQRLRTQR
jgi:tetratricopeptide (TPR) repeat protein